MRRLQNIIDYANLMQEPLNIFWVCGKGIRLGGLEVFEIHFVEMGFGADFLSCSDLIYAKQEAVISYC